MAMAMASISPNCIAALLQDSSPPPSLFVVQILDLKPVGNSNTRFTFLANDGSSSRLKAMLPTSKAPDVTSGKLQNLGLIRITDFTCNVVPNHTQKVLVVIDCEVVSPALDYVVGASSKEEKGISSETLVTPSKPEMPTTSPPITLLPKAEKKSGSVVMSAAQIVQEQRGNAAPAARMGISRRVYPLISLNPYQGNWTIKVRVTGKGPLRTFRNSRGEGNVFNVELTDEDGTQIQATMFKEAADKLFPKLEQGKVYFISKGSLRVANKLYSTVKNDYEMTLNVNSEIEEVKEEGSKIPEFTYHAVKIEELGPYVNGRELVDVIGVVQNVSGIIGIRRKSDNVEIPKRDITIADESKKTVVVSLWNELASKEGEKLLDMVNECPVVLVKGLRASDYQGVSLSTTQQSVVLVNPDLPAARELKSWFSTEGKDLQLTSVGAGLPGGTAGGSARSLYSDRGVISDITQPSVGEGKPAYFTVRAYISFVKPEQAMWYLACQSCNRKVTEELGSKFWCEGCQKHFDNFNRRYILTVKASDSSGEAWVSAFNEQAEQILGHSADKLAEIKSQDADAKLYQAELKKAMWVPYVFRLSVAQTEYMNEKRQRITVRSVTPVDWAGESNYLLEQIAKLKA